MNSLSRIEKPRHMGDRARICRRLAPFFIWLVVLGGLGLDARVAYALSPGEIAIIGVRADDIDGTIGNGNDDALAWVPLVNLAPGAEVFFTDAGWESNNTFRELEGAIKYTAPAGGLAGGTVMLLEFTNSGGNYTFTPSGGGGIYSDADDANVGTTGVRPATPGDNLFIFEGSTASPASSGVGRTKARSMATRPATTPPRYRQV